MNLGEPIRTIIVTPLREPVPQWQPEREPVALPQEEPVEMPEKVTP